MLLLEADVVVAADEAVIGGLRVEVRSVWVSRSVLRSNRFGGDFVARTGSDNSFKHVAGVSKRKSHGWSYPMTTESSERNEEENKKKKKKRKKT